MKIEKTPEGVSLNLSNEELEKIKEEMASHGLLKNKEKKGLPSIGERFWVLPNTGTLETWTFHDDETDKGVISRGNFYLTREEAIKEDERRLALGRIQKFIRDNDIDAPCNGWTPDFEYGSYKYQISGWNYSGNVADTTVYAKFDDSKHGLTFKTAEDRQAVIDNCAKDLEILLKVY